MSHLGKKANGHLLKKSNGHLSLGGDCDDDGETPADPLPTSCCPICDRCCLSDKTTATLTWSISGVTPGCDYGDIPLSGISLLPIVYCGLWSDGISVVATDEGKCPDVAGLPLYIAIQSTDFSRQWQTATPGAADPEFDDLGATGSDGFYWSPIGGTCCSASGVANAALGPTRFHGDGDARCSATLTYTITINNNGCCNCAGGGCMPTSNGTVNTECTGNTCSDTQDDDCGI